RPQRRSDQPSSRQLSEVGHIYVAGLVGRLSDAGESGLVRRNEPEPDVRLWTTPPFTVSDELALLAVVRAEAFGEIGNRTAVVIRIVRFVIPDMTVSTQLELRFHVSAFSIRPLKRSSGVQVSTSTNGICTKASIHCRCP